MKPFPELPDFTWLTDDDICDALFIYGLRCSLWYSCSDFAIYQYIL